MKTYQFLYLILSITLISLCTSCSSSYLGGGLSYDAGNFNQEDIPRSGRGFYLAYRWKNMTGRQGYGFDLNLRSFGYGGGAPGDSEANVLFPIHGRYYYTLIGSDTKDDVRIDFAGGLGTEMRTLTESVLIAIPSAGFEMHFPPGHGIYLTTRFSYYWNIKDRNANRGLELGLGFRIRK